MNVRWRLCPHCNKNVSFKTYKAHRRLFYDVTHDIWFHDDDFSDDDNSSPTPVASVSEISEEIPPSSFGTEPETSTIDSAPSQEYIPADADDTTTLSEWESRNEESDSEIWDDSDEEEVISDMDPPPSSKYTNSTCSNEEDKKMNILVKWVVIFIFHLRVLYSLSDAASNFILKFLSVLLKTVGRILSPSHVVVELPSSVYRMRQVLDGDKNFTRYVVCPKCSYVYEYGKCKESNGTSKTCQYVAFPNHPQYRMRKPCGTCLLKRVELASGRKILYPHLTYCYLSITDSLQSLLLRSSFIDKCNEWRSRTTNSSILQDVYDGKLWKEFQVYEGIPFLSSPYSFAFTINLDWFQPFKHSTYSIGAIYMTVMNLPRNLRNKRENVILVGLLPGPSEPTNINGFLHPLVNELTELWDGKELQISGLPDKKYVRCALLCASCDLPAGRKLCGLLSYSAHQGCSRCTKYFAGIPGQMDYSGFNRDSWISRSALEHRKIALDICSCNTKSATASKESETGYRHTELLRLPYFQPSRMLTIDPMHNLFLGSGKHVLKDIWIERNIITPTQFDLIQGRIDRITSPSDIGRIPNKVKSGFSSFTADQYKNWIIYFSLLSLRDVLAAEDLECWRHFLLACRYLCSRRISQDQIKIADALLMHFCRRCEHLYGKDVITPNMHMHAHLRECLVDYGPAHVFWLFSFERYNGIMENLPTNNRSIEVQVMKRFLEGSTSITSSLPDEYRDEFMSFLSSKHAVGTLSEDYQLPLFSMSESLPLTFWCMNAESNEIELPKYCSRGIFSQFQVQGLQQLYAQLASVSQSDVKISHSYVRYQSILMNRKQIGAYKSRSSSSSLIMAAKSLGSEERPARINYFAKHLATIGNVQYTFLLFHCSWHKPHRDKHMFGKPVTVWENDIFEVDDCTSIIPVKNIRCRTVSLVDRIETGETVLLVCPCVDF